MWESPSGENDSRAFPRRKGEKRNTQNSKKIAGTTMDAERSREQERGKCTEKRGWYGHQRGRDDRP